MIDVYRAGIPGNGQPFPDGSKIAKIAWKPKKSTEAPSSVLIPESLPAVERWSVYEDHARIVREPPDEPRAITLSIDSDTLSEAESFIGGLFS